MQEPKREIYDRPSYPSLQSMRGAAALIVVLGHTNWVFAQTDWLQDILAFVGNGPSAVALFFVLSGTVLAISLHNKQFIVQNYFNFLCRRVFRLIPLVICTSLVGFFYSHLVQFRYTLPGMSPFFTENYQTPLSPVQLITSFIGYSSEPNPPLWSIYVELLGSILLPFLVAIARNEFRLIVLIIMSVIL
jgi:peptidoglycan/LPS O-acetylase OafA/YrhL